LDVDVLTVGNLDVSKKTQYPTEKMLPSQFCEQALQASAEGSSVFFGIDRGKKSRQNFHDRCYDFLKNFAEKIGEKMVIFD
jgi:hypothetical protein